MGPYLSGAKEENLTGCTPKRRKYNFCWGGGITPETDNIISCNFHTDRLYEKLLTDITEFMLPDGKVYLPAMIDCFDRRALGWTIGNHPNADVANRMLGAGNF